VHARLVSRCVAPAPEKPEHSIALLLNKSQGPYSLGRFYDLKQLFKRQYERESKKQQEMEDHKLIVSGKKAKRNKANVAPEPGSPYGLLLQLEKVNQYLEHIIREHEAARKELQKLVEYHGDSIGKVWENAKNLTGSVMDARDKSLRVGFHKIAKVTQLIAWKGNDWIGSLEEFVANAKDVNVKVRNSVHFHDAIEDMEFANMTKYTALRPRDKERVIQFKFMAGKHRAIMATLQKIDLENKFKRLNGPFKTLKKKARQLYGLLYQKELVVYQALIEVLSEKEGVLHQSSKKPVKMDSEEEGDEDSD
jgi:hypothetical protein